MFHRELSFQLFYGGGRLRRHGWEQMLICYGVMV